MWGYGTAEDYTRARGQATDVRADINVRFMMGVAGEPSCRSAALQWGTPSFIYPRPSCTAASIHSTYNSFAI